MNRDGMNVNRIIANILRLGSVISAILMLAGLFLFLVKGYPQQEAHILGFPQALAGSLALEPVALMTLGIVILLLTPLLRVVGAFFAFLLFEKDWKYALISLGVLLILSASLFVPGVR